MKKYFLIVIIGFSLILLAGCFDSNVPLEKGKLDKRLVGKWTKCVGGDVRFDILRYNDREYEVVMYEYDKKSKTYSGKTYRSSMFLTKIDGVYFGTLYIKDSNYMDDYTFGKVEIDKNSFSIRAISNSVGYSKEGEKIKFKSPRQLTDHFFRHMNRKGFYEKTLVKYCRA